MSIIQPKLHRKHTLHPLFFKLKNELQYGIRRTGETSDTIGKDSRKSNRS